MKQRRPWNKGAAGALVAAIALLPSSGRGQPAAGAHPASPSATPTPTPTPQAPAAKPARVVRKPAKPKPAAPAAPAPAVKLTLDAPTTRGPWTMRVTNAGEIPVRIVADARLLTLELTPRGESKPVRCELPGDMRPPDDLERPLVLAPGRTYAETFEPRLYCFGGKRGAALAPGATAVARLGWPRRTHPPYEVSPIDGVEPEVAPLASIESPPIAVPDEPSPSFAPAATPAADVPRLALRGSEAVDAESLTRIAVTVTLRNEGTRAVVVRFQPETLGFDLVGPGGVERCSWPTLPSAPTRELFTTLRPQSATSVTLALADYCPTRAFDRGGLFVLRPHLDTSRASGADLGLRTFDGEVIATAPTLVRLHQGAAPHRLVQPHAEP
jgi:hypothetical protein